MATTEMRELFQPVRAAARVAYDPQLYSAQVVVRVDGKVVDVENATFGIRECKFTADDGFHLNLDGANKLARSIEAEIESEIKARGGKLG